MSGQPDLTRLPTSAALKSYMRATGWDEILPQGSRGSLWRKGAAGFSVPHEDHDPRWLREVVERLAAAEGRTPEDTAAEIGRYAEGRLSVPADEWAAFRAAETGVTLPAVTSPAPGLAERSATATEPAGRVHRPGPRRMVARQLAPSDCLACGQRWPCEGSWQGRAERAEAKLAEVRAVLLEGGQGDATARCRAIAIVGTGEEPS